MFSAGFSETLMDGIGLFGILIMVGSCSAVSFLLVFVFRPKKAPHDDEEEKLLTENDV